jgi:hypothetical protein
MGYITRHNSFTSQYLLNIYIYYRFCRLCTINVCKKIKHFHMLIIQSYNCSIKSYDKDKEASQRISIMKYHNKKNMQGYVIFANL